MDARQQANAALQAEAHFDTIMALSNRGRERGAARVRASKEQTT
jgi:hypothetical protein